MPVAATSYWASTGLEVSMTKVSPCLSCNSRLTSSIHTRRGDSGGRPILPRDLSVALASRIAADARASTGLYVWGNFMSKAVSWLRWRPKPKTWVRWRTGICEVETDMPFYESETSCWQCQVNAYNSLTTRNTKIAVPLESSHWSTFDPSFRLITLLDPNETLNCTTFHL